jgi:hypothetical protein
MHSEIGSNESGVAQTCNPARPSGGSQISVLLPTRNSMSLLPRHVETMRNWLDLVHEVVVVDSESTDGTASFLRQALGPGVNVRFFDHPCGLYQSWNFGIRQVRTRYTYISTIGDEMTREGLLHLAEVAEEHACDAVVSPPGFVDDAGRPLPTEQWPPHWLIAMLGISRPVVLEGGGLMAFAFASLPNAILGSSASNLYRTDCLRQYPFPTDYGTVGDGAWGLAHALHVRMGLTPAKISNFRQHRKSYPESDYAVEQLGERLFALGKASLESALTGSVEEADRRDYRAVRVMLAALEDRLRWQRRLESFREGIWPWSLNPAAWQARYRRERARRTLEAQLRLVLQA